MDYSFHPLADKEVDEIVGSYDGIEDTLGDEFFSELQNALTRVLQLLISSSRGNQMREAGRTPSPTDALPVNES
ncbi:MAG TPA: hypothetical protein DCK93_22225 [Blastocatellia bacterium]|nr:hypothetical protein [Blastocatellia bacterium]